MKRYLFGIGLWLIVFKGLSQQLSTSGQSYLKFYKQSVTKLEKMKPGSIGYNNEVANAERKIKDLKKTDPQYDTSQMESEIAVFKKKSEDAESSNEKSIETKLKFEPKWENMMHEHTESFRLTNDADLNSIESKEKDFEKAFLNFITNEVPKGSQQEEISIDKLKERFNEGPFNYSKNNEFLKNIEDEKGAVTTYYTSKKLAYGWQVLSERFPEIEELKATAASANSKFEELGSVDKIKSLAKTNKAKRIAQTKMEPAVVQDAVLESQIKSALLKSKFASGRNVLTVHLLSKDWLIQRNDLTGIILNRTKAFQAVIKENDGTCTLLRYVDFKQDYISGNFGTGYISLGQPTEILCENAK